MEKKKIPIHDRILRLILSIAMALTLWFTVNGDSDMLITQDYNSIPITLSNQETLADKNLVLADDKSYYMNLKIRGTDRNLRNIDIAEVRAEVDLSDISEKGSYELEVAVKGLPNTVIISSMNPTTLLVEVDSIIKESHEVVIKTEGKPANDRSVIATPVEETVEVEGPEEELARIDKIQGTVNVNGLEEDAVRYVQVSAYDADGNVIEDVEVVPDVVTADIILGQTKTVSVTATTSGSPAEGYIATDITVEPSKLSIGAKQAVIDIINSISTEAIDLSGQSQTFTKEVDLDLPDGAYYLDGNGKVKVTVNIEVPVEKSLTIENIETRNLGADLTVTKVKDTNAVVKLEGDDNVINSILASQVQVYVDCSNLTAGTYELPLQTNLSSAIVKSITPTTTSVTIE
ncbi:CdaR family protein [Eubacteriaceae bacterium ES2]|nr:CdaR family protein [Eubacteriaceae bacterium ES2]